MSTQDWLGGGAGGALMVGPLTAAMPALGLDGPFPADRDLTRYCTLEFVNKRVGLELEKELSGG